MSDDTRQRFDAAVAQAFPVEGKAAESEWSRVADADDAGEAAAGRSASRFTPEDIAAQQELLDSYKAQGRTWGPIRYADVQSLLDEVKASRAVSASTEYDAAMWERIADFADHGAPDDRAVPSERIDAAKRACEGKGAVSQRWDACARLAYSKERRARGGAPNAEHATMAEAVAAVTSASLTLARIERKVDALGNPPRELANITPSWWVGASKGAIASAIAEAVRVGSIESIQASPTMLSVSCIHRSDMTMADLARVVEDAGRAPVIEIAGLADDVQRVASEVGIRATPDAGSPDDTPANRIRNVVAQLVERLRPVTPLPEPSANMLELGQRAAKVAFGDIIGSGDWWKAGVGHDAAHALTHDDAPALRPNERPGDEWSPANWIAFRDAVRRLPRKVYAPAETPAP